MISRQRERHGMETVFELIYAGPAGGGTQVAHGNPFKSSHAQTNP
jgi:hypothetical protein